jgi:hypothetical protein
MSSDHALLGVGSYTLETMWLGGAACNGCATELPEGTHVVSWESDGGEYVYVWCLDCADSLQ